MLETIKQFFIDNSDPLIRAGIAFFLLLATLLAIRIYKRYIRHTAEKHHFNERRANAISKFGTMAIYFVAIIAISNVLGFGIQGIFLATSSLFALVGVAFFANWSILSNVTASVIIYFTFPFRIGDRLLVENEPRFSGILKDVTLFYLKIQNDLGSEITIPANVAIQKIITIQTQADWEHLQQSLLEEKNQA